MDQSLGNGVLRGYCDDACRYGFNPGSQLVLVGLQNSFAVSNCAVTTTLAPAAAGMSALLVRAILTHRTTGAIFTTMGVFTLGVPC